MYVIYAILCFLAGVIILVNPKLIWIITEQWKSYDATEPSDLYIQGTRFAGVIGILLGIGCLVAFFLSM